MSSRDLYTTLKSIDDKLSAVECRIAAIDTKIDGLEKKMVDVILECLDKRTIPYFWDPTTNLLHDVDSKSMHDTIVKQNGKLQKELLNGGTTDSGSDFAPLFHKKNSADIVREISNEFNLISLHDDNTTKENRGESIGSEANEASEFLNMLNAKKQKVGTSEEVPANDVNDRSLSTSDSTSTVSQGSTNSEMSKTTKLNASPVLELISNFIQVTDRSDYIIHYNAVIKYLVDELKTDETFKYTFKGQVMAGSYRDGLKISKPNEYDTILRLSFGDKSNFVVERIPDEPTHCTIKLKECESKPQFKQFLDSEGYLLQDVITIWIQNLFRRILKPHDENGKIIQIGNHSYQYSHSVNGPAFTFKMTVLGTPIKFDLDLVPAIPFDFTHWVATRDYSKDSNQINWIVVAKPPKSGIRRPCRSFTCSYTEMEKHILHDVYQAKNIIRIFKKLRDNQNLPELKSYYIKTIFLWKFDNTTIAERKQFWSRPIDVIFLEMFKTVVQHIKNRELLFYWEPSYNMFSTISETLLKSWEEKLGSIYSRLETIMANKPNGLIDIILSPEEKQVFEKKHPTLFGTQSTLRSCL